MNRAFTIGALLLVVLSVSGCATKGTVTSMIDDNNVLYDQRMAKLAVRMDDLSENQKTQKDHLISYLKRQNQLLTDFIDELEKDDRVKPTINETVPATN